jgi:hypothetical protein
MLASAFANFSKSDGAMPLPMIADDWRIVNHLISLVDVADHLHRRQAL